MIIEMVYSSNFWLNSFPPEDGVSAAHSPRAIVAGMEVNYAKHCKLEFGTYVQTHEEHDNSMATRTTGAIALRPTGNQQGGYYFYSLTTGRRINRNRWTSLPMPNDVIDRVRNLGRQARANVGILFTDRNSNPLQDDDDDAASDSDDETYDPDDDSDSGDNDDYNSDVDNPPIAGVDDDENNDDENNSENENNKTTANENNENMGVPRDEHVEANDKHVEANEHVEANNEHVEATDENIPNLDAENIENTEVEIPIPHSNKNVDDNDDTAPENTNDAQPQNEMRTMTTEATPGSWKRCKQDTDQGIANTPFDQDAHAITPTSTQRSRAQS